MNKRERDTERPGKEIQRNEKPKSNKTESYFDKNEDWIEALQKEMGIRDRYKGKAPYEKPPARKNKRKGSWNDGKKVDESGKVRRDESKRAAPGKKNRSSEQPQRRESSRKPLNENARGRSDRNRRNDRRAQ